MSVTYMYCLMPSSATWQSLLQPGPFICNLFCSAFSCSLFCGAFIYNLVSSILSLLSGVLRCSPSEMPVKTNGKNRHLFRYDTHYWPCSLINEKILFFENLRLFDAIKNMFHLIFMLVSSYS